MNYNMTILTSGIIRVFPSKRLTYEKIVHTIAGAPLMLHTPIKDTVMIIDGGGKLKDKPINSNATAIMSDYIYPWDFIAGDVIIARKELTGLTAVNCHDIMSYIKSEMRDRNINKIYEKGETK